MQGVISSQLLPLTSYVLSLLYCAYTLEKHAWSSSYSVKYLLLEKRDTFFFNKPNKVNIFLGVKVQRPSADVRLLKCEHVTEQHRQLESGLSQGWKLRMEMEARVSKAAFNNASSVDEKKVNRLPKAVCSLMFIKVWPQLQLKRTNKEYKDVYLIDDMKKSWLPRETHFILAENSQTCEMNNNYTGVPP